MVSINGILVALSAYFLFDAYNNLQVMLVWPSVQGGRFQNTVSIRNGKNIQLVNREALEDKGYMVDVHETKGYLFNSITYIYITESQRNPQSTIVSGGEKMKKDIFETDFHIKHTTPNNKTVVERIYSKKRDDRED